MFLAWLFDQTDRHDRVGRFAKFIENDLSNACLPRNATALIIKEHLFERHTVGYMGHLSNLAAAYREYIDFVEISKKR